MVVMSKEQIDEFNRTNNRVDYGTTKRTCATCENRKECELEEVR